MLSEGRSPDTENKKWTGKLAMCRAPSEEDCKTRVVIMIASIPGDPINFAGSQSPCVCSSSLLDNEKVNTKALEFIMSSTPNAIDISCFTLD